MRRLFNSKRFWIFMRNMSGVGALIMLTLALVAAQTDLTMLPIGGDVSDEPERGAVWACRIPEGGRGASGTGSWLDTTNGTFDLTAKAIVDGDNDWNNEFSVQVVGDTRVISGNALPDHNTGTYPIASSDDAYQYDRNPNSIAAQDLMIELPANPTIANQSDCVSMGAIGIMKSGVVLFNALDAVARDAAAYETQDGCEGHPESTGEYHYHTLSPCLAATDTEEGHSILMGYVYDGFGIYGYRGEDGEVLTNDDLDECHGHTHVIEWDGVDVEMYHYHATYEYPYTVGCYRGTVAVSQSMGQGQAGGNGQPPDGNSQPPQGNRPPPGQGNRPPRPGGGG